jgi:hypothetical protein
VTSSTASEPAKEGAPTDAGLSSDAIDSSAGGSGMTELERYVGREPDWSTWWTSFSSGHGGKPLAQLR